MSGHRKLYEEKLVREIMISTALCVQELLMDDPNAGEDDICEFVESNYQSIIGETLAAELEGPEDGARDAGESPERDDF